MIDPIRPEVRDAIAECRKAGIRPIMITGDHRDTAVAIAKQLGILEEGQLALTGQQVDEFSDEDLARNIARFSVYARVQPEHKVRIVTAWKKNDCITAMTGDGVNDAPSIKAADIGIGMGITGTDVTKGVSDMVLADDNFATIVNAVEEGRKIYDNVCKVLQFQLSTNMSEVIIMFVASILNFTILSPVHLLWVNMVTDSLPGLALGMEKAEGNLMKRKPRATTDGIFSGGAGFDMVWQGVYLAIVEIAAFVIGFMFAHPGASLSAIWGANEANNNACLNGMCMAFLAVNFGEIFCAMNMRSRMGSIFSKSMFKNMNWWLIGAFVVTVAFTMLPIYVPFLRDAFFPLADAQAHFTLEPIELVISFCLAFSTVPVFELGKAIRRALNKKKD